MIKALLISVLITAAFPVPLLASEKPVETPAVQTHRRDLTPRERVELNAARSKYAPSKSAEYVRLETSYDASIREESLAERVMAALKADAELSERTFRLKVASKNRAVRLEGVVNDQAERALLEAKAAAVPGVERVENALRVKRSDRDLLEG